MGRRQAIQGVQTALLRGYIRRLEQGSLENGRPSTYGLYWRSAQQAMGWPNPSTDFSGKRDQLQGKKGSAPGEKGISSRGKRDQLQGKRGSAPNSSLDLLEDLDQIRSSSSPPPRTPAVITVAPLGKEEAAALFERVKREFPLGNNALIHRFIDHRGAFVDEVLQAIMEVNPSFLRRFTKSSDPRWAAFHTCCTQGILPPRFRAKPAQEPPSESPLRQEDDEWSRLEARERLERLVALWSQTWRVYVDTPPSEEARREIELSLSEQLAAECSRAEFEEWIFRDIARRRGRSIGPFECPRRG
jgi:hypothetical protein